MSPTLTTIDPRDARAASGDHPLIAHVSAYLADGYPAWQYGAAVAIAYHYWEHPSVTAVGPAGDVAALAEGIGDEVDHWISIPVDAADELPDGFLLDTHRWHFRWTLRHTETARTAARWLTPADDAALNDLLERGFPTASTMPGSPRARRWAGIVEDDRLVAAAVDATGPAGVGFVASITTDPDHRGRGLGRRITGWLLDRLLDEHGRAALWVDGDNPPALRVYDSLGMVDEPMVAGAMPAAHRYVERESTTS